jgi:hypothetical protein
MIDKLLEVLRYPLPSPEEEEEEEADAGSKEGGGVPRRAAATLDALVLDCDAIGLQIRRSKKGEILGVVDVTPGPTRTIEIALGQMGTIAYRDLSAVAHAGMSSLLDRMETVQSRGDLRLMGPGDPSSHIASMAVALLSFTGAQEARTKLYGWNPDEWVEWRRPLKHLMREILPPDSLSSV